MKKLLLALIASTAAVACTDALSSSEQRAIIDTPCAADTDCPTGFECEIEDEHGTTTSYCQSHEEGGDCPVGYELEVEDNQTYCKPHGGDDDSGQSGHDDDSSDDSGNAPTTPGSGASCAVDSDCPAGEECELEVEHGTTTGTCKPHGSV